LDSQQKQQQQLQRLQQQQQQQQPQKLVSAVIACPKLASWLFRKWPVHASTDVARSLVAA